MRYLFVLFLSSASGFFLMSHEWDVEKEISSYDCSTGRFPNGILVGFIDCASTNPLADAFCAGCHGQNEQVDGNGNIVGYGNIVNAGTMNVFRILDGSTQVTEYVPGQEYTLELNMSSFFERKGFNVVVCADNGEKGIFSTIPTETGVQTTNDASGTAATHTANTGIDVWRWKWTAPSTAPGTITFNILTLKDNGVSDNNRDSLFISSEEISPASATLDEMASTQDISVWVAGNTLILGSSNLEYQSLEVEMFSISGQRVLQQRVTLPEQSIIQLDKAVTALSGIYFVQIKDQVGHTFKRKVLITTVN